jgi:hypothetical protein
MSEDSPRFPHVRFRDARDELTDLLGKGNKKCMTT